MSRPTDISWVRRRLGEHRPRHLDPAVIPGRAAVACIFRQRPEQRCCEIMFILRASDEQDPWSGHMAFPGGRMDPPDPSPLHTAIRETREEVGVDLDTGARLLGVLDDIHASAKGRVLPLAISPFAFELTHEVEATTNHEVAEVHWIGVGELLDPASSSTVPYTLGSQRLDLPCFRVRERVIWGLTYQMVMRLFGILGWEVGA